MVDHKDDIIPPERWEFNEDVTQAFQDMLERSIPDYDTMRAMTFLIGCGFVEPRTDIVDLGCSRGDALDPFVRKYGAYNHYVGVEVSGPMQQAFRERFIGYIQSGVVELRDTDLRREYPPVSASLTLAVLTIQFTPIEYRNRILRNIYEHTVKGGALVMVEKVLGRNMTTDDLLTGTYYRHKKDVGYTDDQIQRKRLSLEGVLVPVSAQHNEQMLGEAGFGAVECYWRCLNFAGWVAIK